MDTPPAALPARRSCVLSQWSLTRHLPHFPQSAYQCCRTLPIMHHGHIVCGLKLCERHSFALSLLTGQQQSVSVLRSCFAGLGFGWLARNCPDRVPRRYTFENEVKALLAAVKTPPMPPPPPPFQQRQQRQPRNHRCAADGDCDSDSGSCEASKAGLQCVVPMAMARSAAS